MELGSDFLGKLYATCEHQSYWTPVLDELCTQLDACSAVVQILKETPERLEVVWQARDALSTANSDLHDRWVNNSENPRLHKGLVSRLPSATAADVVYIGSDRRLFGRFPGLLSDLHGRLALVGLGDAFWASFPISNGRRFSLVLHRPAGHGGDLTQSEESVLRQLVPHMERLARLRALFDHSTARTSTLENALHSLDLALILCDADLQIRWSNAAADELIERVDCLRISAGKLLARSAADAALLRRLVGSVVARKTDSRVGVIGADEDRPLHIRVVSSPGNETNKEGVSLFLSQPCIGGRIDPAELQALYGLTPAEARLATGLVGGASISNYSEQRGIAVGTARNQLKQILTKTYTNSQLELVRTLCSSAAVRTRQRTH